jgi:hypothetical protein
MAGSRTPRPPLPFGSPQNYEKNLAPAADRLSNPEGVSPEQLASVNQLKDLLGAQLRSKLALRGELGAGTEKVQTDSGALDTNNNRVRTPFVMTCQEWLSQTSPRYIIAAVNPSEISWRLPQRAAAQKTRIGEIVHYWRDRFRNTFFDEPQLSITFQSGNIMPMRTKPLVTTGIFNRQVRYVQPIRRIDGVPVQNPDQFVEVPKLGPDPTEQTPQVPPGLKNFYEFLELIDTQKILDSGDVNLVYLIYNSRIFPNMTLAGLFTPDGVSWTDSATDPNQVTSWSATFTVYDSFPRLNDNAALIKMFEQAGWGRV